MKFKFIISVAAGCILMLCGCKDDKPQYGASMNVKVFGVTGKADLLSDMQKELLPADLKVGVFVGEPVNIENVPASVTANGTISPEKDIKWAYDQSRSSRFFVYSPYDESYTGQESVIIRMPADQSTKEKMLKGNLLTAIASGGPKESAVTMQLKHAMTAMNILFDNRSGYKIEYVSVSGFMTMGKMNLITGSLKATGEKKGIKPLRSSSDENSFSFIYIPQDVTPFFNVTLSSGKTMEFTFDNYCHEYPGNIIKMQIQIDENTPEKNVLPLSGVSITQWTSNGVPSFSQVGSYINLNRLKDVETDKDNGFFSAYLNKVTVTAVDRTSNDVLGVIIEDSTRAVHVWTYYDSPLKVGSTIVGPVMGIMDKPSDNEFHVAYFYTDYATLGKTDSLPCTEGRFSEIGENIEKWEYRRMMFKDVVLEENFNNERAVFVQDTVRMSVVCPGIDYMMTNGIKGDLIGFPVRSGQDIMIMVYDESQFGSFTKDAVDNALTRDSIYGLYDLSTPELPEYYMSGNNMELQYSVRQFNYGRTMQVADTRNGEVHLILMYDYTGIPVIGHEYEIAFNAMGKSDKKGITMYMECVKVDDKTAWLIDRAGKYGLILAL